ncbi:alpha/beta hydrolase [Marinimicrobium sp. ABcell2]|uniref:alpha/beta hydrolase n=1 Tax=Marinimicrobium sp. ABcell2 TaxID=3069751 RepID=UPI0027B522BF|nr:alpha/beta hydrolase [Marinimicrobium sp. ABcell2]MDQ2076911.1 alpha/beta hydrolase [Marinimicrobium sp. ABcell2]
MAVKILKWFSALILIMSALGAYYSWSNLPYHQLPVVHDSAEWPNTANEAPLQPTYRDVAYSAQSRFQKLDVYLPESGNGPFPLVIWVHGGGLIMGDKSSMPQTDFGPAPTPTGPYGPYQVQVPDVYLLHAHGYAVASINYRLGVSPVTAAKSAIRDTKAAVRFLRANANTYNIDPNRFAIWGNSMGGYLAAMAGATGDRATDFDDSELFPLEASSSVQAVVVWYGAEDRMPGKNLSLEHQISQAKNLPPFYIVNGNNDTVITEEQATRLHHALKKAGADSTLVILPDVGHEDPLFRKTQMKPTVNFIRQAMK